MDWLDKKFLKNAFRVASLIVLLMATYLLYSYYKAQNLADYQMQNSYTYPKHTDSAKRSENRAFADTQTDHVKSLRNENLPSSSYTRTNLYPPQKDSSASAVPESIYEETDNIKSGENTRTLHGPSALFFREYAIAIGKTIPVTVWWANSSDAPTHFKLFTIKVNDIAGNKAWFTIEDPFSVLLFSQAGYAVNDKIIIDDERHNINISVLQVHTNSVVVKISSHLNDGIISKLQKAE